MDYSEALELVAGKTMEMRYIPAKTDYSFFRWKDQKGMELDNGYAHTVLIDPYIDMRYNVFDWHQGVGFDSLLKAAETDSALAKPVKSFVDTWLTERMADGLPPVTINTTVPLLCMLHSSIREGHPQYLPLCRERAEQLLNCAPRTSDGAFEHTVIGINRSFHGQMWADTMYMAGVFLGRMYAVTGNESYAHEACRQVILHYKHLTDPDTGLLFHAFDSMSDSHLSAVRWVRANGWGLLACVNLLELIPREWDEWSAIFQFLRQHAHAVQAVQRLDGSFGTVLDMPSSVSETTIACAYYAAARKAIRMGWIESSFMTSCDKAIAYVLRQIRGDGIVQECSGGTPVMCDRETYNRIPMVMSYYGQGLCLQTLCEAMKQHSSNREVSILNE